MGSDVNGIKFYELGHRLVTKGNVATAKTPGVNVIKLFSFVTDDEAEQAGVFFLGNPFQSSLRV